ncbi:hypothetical protein J5J83_13750 [Azoarcus sp. L1K30]|uniref:COG4648 family protein n=1 Tax=Azoarcus sp. L1K30 TaxID=2820277 RepID=UPI001B813D0B|nr:hypothetical protein [Azoarcus sp. L1K30]MBR0567182.1 hypothetical protein [Azoarcus sp. L1K30]
MPRGMRLVRAVLLAVAFGAYLLLAHFTTAPDEPSTLGALVAIVPYMAIALGLALRSARRALALALWSALSMLLWRNWPLVESRFEWIYFIQHCGTFSLLAIGFGRTLTKDAVPMVTRFAQVIHGDELAPALKRYTRRVTVAWSVFFVAMAGTSALLFFTGPMPAWSLLINVLTPILVAAVFALEFAIRSVVLPPTLRTGLVDSVRACLQTSRRITPPTA